MFKLSSEDELLECFRAVDRDEVIVPEAIRFPLMVRDYATWVEPSGHRVYVVFSDGRSASPLGIVFTRTQSSSDAPAAMCEWCHSVRPGNEVGLLCATASAKRRVGLHLCRDLSCKDKVKAPPGVFDYPINTSEQERVRRIIAKMGDFARRDLF